MAIGITIDMCCTNRWVDRAAAQKYAPFLDLIAGAALLIIGILAINGTIPCSTNVAYGLLGAGCCYVGLIIYRLIEKAKRHSPLEDCRLC